MMPNPRVISSLLKRIKAHPNNAELFQRLGNLYFKKGCVRKAKTAYDRSLDLNPADPWTHLFVGNWHYAAGEYREALEHFRYAAQYVPQIPAQFWALGDAYAALGIDGLATESYQHALELDPDDKMAKKKWRKWVESCEVEG
ncbi:MAG TPA: tetratricopeptide repeat protein [Verrucomicrobiae bacterium]